VDPTVGAAQFIGAMEAAEEAAGKTVFESTKERPSMKRKYSTNENTSDTE
jgi:hypothetical protein